MEMTVADKEHSSDVTIYTVHGDLLPHHVVAKTDYDLLAAEVAALRERLAEVREIQQRTEGNATELHIAMYEWIRKEDKP